MRHSLLVVIASSLSLASTATAGLLPSKPSQLADVSSGSNISCKFFAQAYAIDTVQESDGTAATFEIPAKHVFVVTSVDFNIQGPASGHRYEAAVSRENPTTGANANITEIAGVSNGSVNATIVIPSGSVVKSGMRLCSVVDDFTDFSHPIAEVIVHGFFAADK